MKQGQLNNLNIILRIETYQIQADIITQNDKLFYQLLINLWYIKIFYFLQNGHILKIELVV